MPTVLYLLVRCLTPGAWVVGEPGESCTRACAAMSAAHPPRLLGGTVGKWICDTSSEARMITVDSPAKFAAAVSVAGHGEWCLSIGPNLHGHAYPGVAAQQEACFYRFPGASDATAACGATPFGARERRLCCCVIEGSAGQAAANAIAACPNEPCPPSTASPSGMAPACELCPAGRLGNRNIGATSCVAASGCPAGTYARGAVTTAPSAAPSPHPTYFIDVPTATPAPTMWSHTPTAAPNIYPTFNPTAPTSMPSDAPSTSAPPPTMPPSSPLCAPCPANTFTAEAGGTSRAHCIACRVGRYSRSGSTSCSDEGWHLGPPHWSCDAVCGQLALHCDQSRIAAVPAAPGGTNGKTSPMLAAMTLAGMGSGESSSTCTDAVGEIAPIRQLPFIPPQLGSSGRAVGQCFAGAEGNAPSFCISRAPLNAGADVPTCAGFTSLYSSGQCSASSSSSSSSDDDGGTPSSPTPTPPTPTPPTPTPPTNLPALSSYATPGWVVGDAGMSCDAACSNSSTVCSATGTLSATDGVQFKGALTSIGQACTNYGTGTPGTDLEFPALFEGTCYGKIAGAGIPGNNCAEAYATSRRLCCCGVDASSCTFATAAPTAAAASPAPTIAPTLLPSPLPPAPTAVFRRLCCCAHSAVRDAATALDPDKNGATIALICPLELVPCEAGTYSARSGGSKPCTLCAAGRYAAHAGQTSCSGQCGNGSYSGPGQSRCENCPVHRSFSPALATRNEDCVALPPPPRSTEPVALDERRRGEEGVLGLTVAGTIAIAVATTLAACAALASVASALVVILLVATRHLRCGARGGEAPAAAIVGGGGADVELPPLRANRTAAANGSSKVKAPPSSSSGPNPLFIEAERGRAVPSARTRKRVQRATKRRNSTFALSVEEQEQEPPMSLGAVAARMGSAEKKVKVRATTDAKRLAADATINLRDVTATGADGRMVTKSDVEAFLAEQRRGGTTTAGKASRATAEMRVSQDDGVSYTRGEFIEFYGGTTEWDAAKGRTPRLQTK